MTSLENEEHILEDNRLQMSWVEMIQPKRVIPIIIKKFKSMLKFRCAYPTEISKPTEFFKGDILI
jgi:cap2 methyltransferase